MSACMWSYNMFIFSFPTKRSHGSPYSGEEPDAWRLIPVLIVLSRSEARATHERRPRMGSLCERRVRHVMRSLLRPLHSLAIPSLSFRRDLRSKNLGILRYEKPWRPFVTLEVDCQRKNEIVLGVEDQNPNQREINLL